MKRIFLIIFSAIIFSAVSAQITFNHRYDFDSLSNIITGILPTDSCYYAIGIIADSVNMAAPGNIFIKFDLNGEILFEKRYTNPNKTYETWFGGLKSNQIGELITFGHSIDTMRYGLLIRYNTLGDTISTRQYLSPNYSLTSNPFFVLEDFALTQDGGYIFVGNTSTAVAKDIAVFKLDSIGNVIWAKMYGTSYPDIPKNITQNDDGYLIGGMSWDQQEYYRNYIFQIDEDGDVLWEYLSPLEDKKFGAEDIIVLPTEEKIVATTFVKSETLDDAKGVGGVYKMNENFDVIWEKEIHLAIPSNNNYKSKLVEIEGEDNYAILGLIDNPKQSAWVTKISSEGDSLWSRTYSYPNLSNSAVHRIYDFQATSDGGFLICGETRADNNINQRGWLLKLDENGCLVPGCHIVDNTTSLEKDIEVKIYPNPTSDYLNIFIRGEIGKVVARIINLEGLVIDTFEIEGNNSTFISSVSHLAEGIYFLQILDTDKRMATLEFVVHR